MAFTDIRQLGRFVDANDIYFIDAAEVNSLNFRFSIHLSSGETFNLLGIAINTYKSRSVYRE